MESIETSATWIKNLLRAEAFPHPVFELAFRWLEEHRIPVDFVEGTRSLLS